MTSEYGAASQLEKIDMLDFARPASCSTSSRSAARRMRCATCASSGAATIPHRLRIPDGELPVYPTIASRFNDPGVNRLFAAITRQLDEKAISPLAWSVADNGPPRLTAPAALIPQDRARYLAEIAGIGRSAREQGLRQAEAAQRAGGLFMSLQALRRSGAAPAAGCLSGRPHWRRRHVGCDAAAPCAPPTTRPWSSRARRRRGAEGLARAARGHHGRALHLHGARPAGQPARTTPQRSAAPASRSSRRRGFEDWGERLRFILSENLPGAYPYTGGVYPYRREAEDPIRMFAGEGTPERTNRRFHYLARGQQATRLSTAFDSATLYGEDPDQRPDIYGSAGNSGVSIATLDDMKKLYSGFDLCDPATSVSMTINGRRRCSWRCS